MASTAALSAASQDRKARLAQLKSLKRKQEAIQDDAAPEEAQPTNDSSQGEPPTDEVAGVSQYLSGRNYDFESKGAKLGFETAPSAGKDTLERQATALAEATRLQAEEEEKEDKALDLFKLQPKKPNWDLKRDLERKLEVLNVRTDNAIARLVRERIAKQQHAAKSKPTSNIAGVSGGDAEAAGIEGTTLVEATNVREREDEEEARKEREEEDALLGDT